MRSLLEHDVTNTPSPLECAREHGRTDLQDERLRVRSAASLLGGQAENVVLVCRWRASSESGDMRCSGSCLSTSFRPVFGHCFGAYATPGGRLALLLCYAPSGLRFPSAMDPP